LLCIITDFFKVITKFVHNYSCTSKHFLPFSKNCCLWIVLVLFLLCLKLNRLLPGVFGITPTANRTQAT
jgi:hypothetical protein